MMELLWAISTKTAAGNPGVRIYRHSVSNGSLVSTVPCNGVLGDLEQWLREHIVLDANGKPALHLIEAT